MSDADIPPLQRGDEAIEQISQSGLEQSEAEYIAERSHEIDRGLIGLYKEYAHELSAPRPTGVRVPVDPGFVTKRAADIIQAIISEVGGIQVLGGLSPSDHEWVDDEIKKFHQKLKRADAPTEEEPIVLPLTQSDIQDVVFFVLYFLIRRHPGKMIREIEGEVDQETMDHDLREEQGLLSPEEKMKREEIIHESAVRLYATAFEWGYFPELVSELGLKGTKTENRLKIEAEEARLIDILKIPTNDVDNHLKMILKKIQGGKASSDEVLFYKLSRNKCRSQWFTNICAQIEEIAAIRGDQFLELWNKAHALSQKVQWMKRVLPDEDRIEMEEQLILLGRDIAEAESKMSAGENEVIEGDRIVCDIFFELFPSSEYPRLRNPVTGKINEVRLAGILGIEPVFAVFEREEKKREEEAREYPEEEKERQKMMGGHALYDLFYNRSIDESAYLSDDDKRAYHDRIMKYAARSSDEEVQMSLANGYFTRNREELARIHASVAQSNIDILTAGQLMRYDRWRRFSQLSITEQQRINQKVLDVGADLLEEPYRGLYYRYRKNKYRRNWFTSVIAQIRKLILFKVISSKNAPELQTKNDKLEEKINAQKKNTHANIIVADSMILQTLELLFPSISGLEDDERKKKLQELLGIAEEEPTSLSPRT